MRPEVNSNRCQISFLGKISLRCKVTSLSIKELKGQNLAGTWCCGFLVLEFRCRGFFSLRISTSWLFVLWKNALESRYRSLFVFISWCRGVLVPKSWCRDFWSRNFDVMVFLPWNPDVVVYVPPRSRFRFY